jgi:hypothetical protein
MLAKSQVFRARHLQCDAVLPDDASQNRQPLGIFALYSPILPHVSRDERPSHRVYMFFQFVTAGRFSGQNKEPSRVPFLWQEFGAESVILVTVA